WPSKIIAFITCIVASEFAYSDPYFIFFTIMPITALFAVLFLLKKVPRRTFFVILGHSVLSICLAKLIAYGVTVIGLKTPTGTGVVVSGFQKILPDMGHAL